jgi:hypothetical protein
MKPNANDRRDQPQQQGQRQQGQQQQGQQQQGQQQQGQQQGTDQQYGEGNYKATRDYDRGVKEHLQNHDIEREARDAAPNSPAEEKEMEDAERQGRSRAKSGGDEDMRRAGGDAQDPGEDVK